MIKRITFPCVWVDGEDNQYTGAAEFKLGPGPCGKDVSHLAYDFTETLLLIRQSCSDGERKDFLYQLADITGRIEVEYA